jgi:hypothetical protein
MKKEGVMKMANDKKWSRTMATDVYLYFNFAVIFFSTYFRFRSVKRNVKGDF